MRNLKIKFFIILAFLIGAILYFIYTINEVKLEIESNLGKSVIISQDTLLITNYSTIRHSYMLENGKQIDFDLAEKIIIP